MPGSVPVDIVVLLLRASIIVVLYLFLFSMVRIIQRELRAESAARPDAVRGRLIILDPGTTARATGQSISLETVTRLGRSGDNTSRITPVLDKGNHAVALGFHPRLEDTLSKDLQVAQVLLDF